MINQAPINNIKTVEKVTLDCITTEGKICQLIYTGIKDTELESEYDTPCFGYGFVSPRSSIYNSVAFRASNSSIIYPEIEQSQDEEDEEDEPIEEGISW